MKSLLTELEAHAGKTAYQTYIMQHGIETITVLIPLQCAAIFETEFAKSTDKSKRALLEVVTRHAGKVRA